MRQRRRTVFEKKASDGERRHDRAGRAERGEEQNPQRRESGDAANFENRGPCQIAHKTFLFRFVRHEGESYCIITV